MLRDGLSLSVVNAFYVVKYANDLYFYDNDFPFAVFGFYVYPVELVVLALLVALAFQYLHDLSLIIEKHRQQSLEHTEVRLISQQPFNGPVKPYIKIIFHTSNIKKLRNLSYKTTIFF